MIARTWDRDQHLLNLDLEGKYKSCTCSPLAWRPPLPKTWVGWSPLRCREGVGEDICRSRPRSPRPEMRKYFLVHNFAFHSLRKIAILRQEEKGHFLSVGASGMVLGPPRALHVQRSGSKRIYYSKEMFAELIKAQVHRKGGWLTLVLHNWIVKYIWSILLSFDDFNWDKDFFKCECHFFHQDQGGRLMSIDTNIIFFLHFFNTS